MRLKKKACTISRSALGVSGNLSTVGVVAAVILGIELTYPQGRRVFHDDLILEQHTSIDCILIAHGRLANADGRCVEASESHRRFCSYESS